MKGFIIVLILTCNLLDLCEAIWLNLPSSGTKCVSQDIQINVIVLADYYVVNEDLTSPGQTISIQVSSPYGYSLHHKSNVTHGQFAFTTHEAGSYLACFWMDGQNVKDSDITINLDWRIGVAAKDWDAVARKENIEGVELELRKLEGAVEAVHENLLHLKNKEAEMRMMSEKTNTRVTLCSLMSLAVCITASGIQSVYLKRYFYKKKLI